MKNPAKFGFLSTLAVVTVCVVAGAIWGVRRYFVNHPKDDLKPTPPAVIQETDINVPSNANEVVVTVDPDADPTVTPPIIHFNGGDTDTDDTDDTDNTAAQEKIDHANLIEAERNKVLVESTVNLPTGVIKQGEAVNITGKVTVKPLNDLSEAQIAHLYLELYKSVDGEYTLCDKVYIDDSIHGTLPTEYNFEHAIETYDVQVNWGDIITQADLESGDYMAVLLATIKTPNVTVDDLVNHTALKIKVTDSKFSIEQAAVQPIEIQDGDTAESEDRTESQTETTPEVTPPVDQPEVTKPESQTETTPEVTPPIVTPPVDQPETTPEVTPPVQAPVATMNITGVKKPSGKYTQGSSFGFEGKITVENDKITSITGGIYDANGKDVMSVSDKYKTGKEVTSYNIKKGAINDELIFDTLKPGSYTYRVSITTTSNTDEQVIIESTFTVEAKKTTVVDTQTTLDAVANTTGVIPDSMFQPTVTVVSGTLDEAKSNVLRYSLKGFSMLFLSPAQQKQPYDAEVIYGYAGSGVNYKAYKAICDRHPVGATYLLNKGLLSKSNEYYNELYGCKGYDFDLGQFYLTQSGQPIGSLPAHQMVFVCSDDSGFFRDATIAVPSGPRDKSPIVYAYTSFLYWQVIDFWNPLNYISGATAEGASHTEGKYARINNLVADDDYWIDRYEGRNYPLNKGTAHSCGEEVWNGGWDARLGKWIYLDGFSAEYPKGIPGYTWD